MMPVLPKTTRKYDTPQKSSTTPTHGKVTANPYWFFINDLY
jgi:hypothetical protein